MTAKYGRRNSYYSETGGNRWVKRFTLLCFIIHQWLWSCLVDASCAFSIHHYTHTHIYIVYTVNIYQIYMRYYFKYIYIFVSVYAIYVYISVFTYLYVCIYTYTVCVQLSRFGCRAPNAIAQSRIFAVYKKFEIPNIFIHIFHFSGQNKYFLA